MSTRVPFSRGFVVAAGAAMLLHAGVATAGASSDFSSDAEGWLLYGDSVTSAPTYVATGGNPGGYINGTDKVLGGVWYFLAPAKFLGDNSTSYGQTLSFDLRMRGSGPLFADSDVILAGGGLSLHYDFASVPADLTWTPYSVVLSEAAGWKVGSLSGPAATNAQMHSVLASVTSLKIRGEFITGPDNGDLDNVVLGAVPEPQTYAMMAAGLALLGWIVRRRKLPN